MIRMMMMMKKKIGSEKLRIFEPPFSLHMVSKLEGVRWHLWSHLIGPPISYYFPFPFTLPSSNLNQIKSN